MARKSGKKMDIKAIAMDALALSGGAAASGIVDSMLLSKLSFASDPKIKGLLKVAAGSFLPPLIARGKGGEFIERFGDGMVSIGGYQLMHALLPNQIPAISGIGNNLPAYPPKVQIGATAPQLNTLSGLPTLEGIGENEGDNFLE